MAVPPRLQDSMTSDAHLGKGRCHARHRHRDFLSQQAPGPVSTRRSRRHVTGLEQTGIPARARSLSAPSCLHWQRHIWQSGLKSGPVVSRRPSCHRLDFIMDNLAGYASSDGEDEARNGRDASEVSSSESEGGSTDVEDEDPKYRYYSLPRLGHRDAAQEQRWPRPRHGPSLRRRARELTASRAAARAASSSSLPDPLAALQQVPGSLDFLNPEATRQINRMAHGAGEAEENAGGPADPGPTRGQVRQQAVVAALLPRSPAEPTVPGRRHTQPKGPEFDISRLAPKLPSESKRKQGPVVQGEAKRAKTAQELHMEAVGTASSLAIAALGGHAEGKRPGTEAMPLEDFISRGLGGAQLPRKKGSDR